MSVKVTKSSNLNSMLMKHCVRVISLLDELKKLCDLQGTVHLDGDYPLAITGTDRTCVGPFNVSGGWFQTIIARRKAEIIDELFDMGHDLTSFEEPEEADDE
ncbi:hypothetical protein KUL113_03810 [Tenacibaculum sp. KUL113]|nr:hypothetical protein KUL113_03810 [Tenacibaculum sp. KUL113]